MSSEPASRQLTFDLPSRPALGRSNFFVSPSNEVALALVEAWPAWPSRRLAVVGPPGSGKTHLAHVWAARAGARILTAEELLSLDLAVVPGDLAIAVEDGDAIANLDPRSARAAETALFHLCNRLGEGGGSLLLTGLDGPARWRTKLPDLASRLSTAGVARLEIPDDALLGAVLVKLFTDRQIVVELDLIRYLVPRIERAFDAAESIVDRLDRAGLSRLRPITPRLASEVLRDDLLRAGACDIHSSKFP